MPLWYSPFPIPASLSQVLDATGMTRVETPSQLSAEFMKNNPCILLYDAPHRLFTAKVQGDRTPTEIDILEAYRQILALADLSVRLLSVERLSNASATDLETCLLRQRAPDLDMPLGEPKPLEALITLRILQQCSDLLDAYLEIDAKAELQGKEEDSNYIGRLRRALEGKTAADYLQEWREESESMLDALREQLDKKIEEVNEVNSTLKLAYQEHEHYFLMSKRLQSLLDQHEEQGARTLLLLSGIYRSLSSQ